MATLQDLLKKESEVSRVVPPQVDLETPPWEGTSQFMDEPEAPPMPHLSMEAPRDLRSVPLAEWTHEEKLRMLPYAVKAAAALRKSWGEPMFPALYSIVYLAVTRHGITREELITRRLGALQMKHYWTGIKETNGEWPDKQAFWKLAFSLAGNHRGKTRVAYITRGTTRFYHDEKHWFYQDVSLRKFDEDSGQGALVCLG